MNHTFNVNFTYIILIIFFIYFGITKSDSIANVTGIMVAMLLTNYFYLLYLIFFYASAKFLLKNIISSGSFSYSFVKKYLVCLLKTLPNTFPYIFTMLC